MACRWFCVLAMMLFSTALAAQVSDLTSPTLTRTLNPQLGGTELLGEMSEPTVVRYILPDGTDASKVRISGEVNCTVAIANADETGMSLAVKPTSPGAFSFKLDVADGNGGAQEVPVTGVLLAHSECHWHDGERHCDDHHHCSAAEGLVSPFMIFALAGLLLLAARQTHTRIR